MKTIDTPVEKLFNNILKQELIYIDDVITNKTTENYYLDFKTTENIDYTGQRKLFNSDKKNYAKAISAFANSEGGILVWGVETGKSDVDYAIAKKSIKNVSNFKSLLESFSSLLTSPVHSSIFNHIIFEDKVNDIGYVITHIPKSSKRPLQVLNDNDYRYYIRAGSSSLPAPDTFIRSLFGQGTQPNAFIVFGTSPIELTQENIIKIKAGVIIYNKGENIAKNINGYVSVGGLGLAIELSDDKSFDYYKNSISGMKVGFTAKPTFILGVEQEVLPLTIHIEISKPITANGIQILALINADNQNSYRLERTIDKETLETAYDKYLIDKIEKDLINTILKDPNE